MSTAAGLPLPWVSRGRFAHAHDGAVARLPGTPETSWVHAYTDEALFEACGVRIAFAERGGGVSGAPYDSLDMGAPGRDDEGYVNDAHINRAMFARAVGFEGSMDAVVVPNQVHADSIVCVSADDDAHLRRARFQAEEGCDAVMVSCAGVAALLRFADCLPLVLVAPTGAFAVVHCGWKGAIMHLAAQALRTLASHAACDPAQINAYIGAYIHVECFEVGQDTAERFVQQFAPSVAHLDDETDTWRVDLGASVRFDLREAGIASERIADVACCTVCDADRFYSYRAADGLTGRHGVMAFRTIRAGGAQ